MGTKTLALQQQSSVLVLVLGLAMALALSLLSAQTAEGALTIVNNRPYSCILYHPPGCCSPFGFLPPPHGYGCRRCPMVFLDANSTTTLRPIVGPYPLQFLQIIGGDPRDGGHTYCAIGRNLNATNTMTIGAKECYHGIEVQIAETGKNTTTDGVPTSTFCMKRCFG